MENFDGKLDRWLEPPDEFTGECVEDCPGGVRCDCRRIRKEEAENFMLERGS